MRVAQVDMEQDFEGKKCQRCKQIIGIQSLFIIGFANKGVYFFDNRENDSWPVDSLPIAWVERIE